LFRWEDGNNLSLHACEDWIWIDGDWYRALLPTRAPLVILIGIYRVYRTLV
jgi:hypothetical protein